MGIRREVKRKLIERAAGVFGVAAASLSDLTRFAEDLNAKSTQITQITTFLEDEFDTEIPFMDFRRKETFGEAIDYIVEKAVELNLGARGLRSIVEKIMTNAMYEFPSSNKKSMSITLKYAKEQFEHSIFKFLN